ncbi:GNAT family N-acetyltransferase [Ornithinibacillus scapharcae]|uniref:GNAT family N-acetyltransferase n=1 Tax=Ornithinibacillus scapharcae TaxID=1147159 RepID=UPI000225C044|nr:GNAT family N-acetyltransferase [Ornithinibacillus scapharcae]
MGSEKEFRFTSRMQSIMQNTEKYARMNEDKVVVPLHLLKACLWERGGAMGELSLKCHLNVNKIEVIQVVPENDRLLPNKYFSLPITEEVELVFDIAIRTMKRYNQLFLNEGHVLKALITTKVLDNYVSEKSKEAILKLGTTARDMITHIGNYVFPKIDINGIRKVTLKDKDGLIQFVRENFSPDWAKTISAAFLLHEPSIFVALDERGNYIGFAAYDIYQNKRGYFGPMGVLPDNRISGVGYSLLHHCLCEMKEIGYEYAVIGGAGPIEFYEKACHAVVIPAPLYKRGDNNDQNFNDETR